MDQQDSPTVALPDNSPRYLPVYLAVEITRIFDRSKASGSQRRAALRMAKAITNADLELHDADMEARMKIHRDKTEAMLEEYKKSQT